MNSRKKVKYQVTGAFADLSVGEIINAYVIAKGDCAVALVYHPSSKKDDYCGSLEFCEKGKDNIYRTVKKTENSYINLSNSDDKFFKHLKVK